MMASVRHDQFGIINWMGELAMKTRSFVLFLVCSCCFLLVSCFGTVGSSEVKTALSDPHGRLVVLLVDVTASYPPSEEDTKCAISKVVRALGPGDSFLFVTIGPSFNPRDNVRIQCQMASLPVSLFDSASNITGWKQSNERLQRGWQRVDSSIDSILRIIEQPVERLRHGGTDLYSVLEYTAWRLGRETHREKFLLIFSDLIHEEHGVSRNGLPPVTALNLGDVSVAALGIPWVSQDAWIATEAAWEEYFVNRSGAIRFKMVDPVAMLQQRFLPVSEVPRKLKMEFAANN
jgi:hypothetical protein